MLRRMKFAHKVALMPALAGAGFLVILAAALSLGTRNARILSRIGEGHVPAVESSLQLERTLEDLQRSLQDAGTTRDMAVLQEADQHRDRFLEGLLQAESNPTLRQERIESLQSAFSAYYALARHNSEQTI